MTREDAIEDRVIETFPDMDTVTQYAIITVMANCDKDTLIQIKDLIDVINELEY